MKSTRWAIFVVALMLTNSAISQEYEFNGFLSAVGGTVIDDDTIYAGFDDDVAFEPDSVLGIQINANISDRLQAVAQVLGRGSDDFDAELEWAYLAYEASENFTLRAGRLRVPFFQYSDFLDVSYAYPFIRPPVEVYEQINITSYQGADVLYNWNSGSWSNEIQVYFGTDNSNQEVAGATTNQEINALSGIVLSTSNNLLSFRASAHRGDVTAFVPDLVPLFDGLRQAGFGSVADSLEVRDKEAQFFGLSGGYDDGRFFARGEWTKLDWQDESFLSTVDSWYANVGTRVGDFTYHLTYSEADQTPDANFSAPIPGGIAPQLDQLKATVDALPTRADDQAISAGVRWDFAPNIAYKLEYSDVSRDTPGEKDTGLISTGFDVIF